MRMRLKMRGASLLLSSSHNSRLLRLSVLLVRGYVPLALRAIAARRSAFLRSLNLCCK